MAAEHLTALDATFLELEDADPGAHMHIGGLLVFDPLPGGDPPLYEEVLVRVDERLDSIPRCRQRLSEPTLGGLTWPAWVEDERFDLAAHVRHVALPEPGGDRELLDWAEDFYAHRLDRGRPLWELAMIDGLAGGRWAVALKVHHAVVDGVAALGLTRLVLDEVPADPTPHDPPRAALTAAAGRLAGIVRDGAGLAVHPRASLERGKGLLELLVRDEAIPAPHASLNVPIGKGRRLAVTEASLDDLKAVRAALGGTVNDVVLACVAGGLRRLMLDRGERPPGRGLRAMVPVDVRAAGAELQLGNHVSSLFVPLPVGVADPLERHAAVVEATAAHKAGHEARAAKDMIALGAIAPPAVHSALARAVAAPRLFNLTVTNVPGPQVTLHALDAPLRRIVPLVPLASDHTVGVAVLSYAGTVCFCVQADRASVPDIEALSEGIAAELRALRTTVVAA